METALAQLDKKGRNSKKFWAHALSLLAISALGVAAMYWKADAALVAVIVGPLALGTAGYHGSTSWMERAVRMAAVHKGTTTE